MTRFFTLPFTSSMIAVFFLSIFFPPAFAQAPTITSNAGYPIGNANGVGVAYGNGVYVTATSTSGVYRSSTADAWTRIPAGSAITAQDTITAITFGTGNFVIVGLHGYMSRSTDGINWTRITPITTANLTDVQFLQSAFYAVGLSRTMLRSTDGTNWSPVVINTGDATHRFFNITYGNGYFVASARTAGGANAYIYRSATGASNSFTFSSIAGQDVNRLLFLKDRFYMFCLSTAVYTSSDGSSWVNSTSSMPLTLPNGTTQTVGSPNQAFRGVYDGNKIYFFGTTQYHNGYGSVSSSTDGVNFTLQPKTPSLVVQGAAYLNGKYFIYGNEGIISSTDGINYKYPSGSYSAVATNGINYVGVGFIGESGVVFSSPDFNIFTERTPANQSELNGVVYDGSRYVAAGNKTVIQSPDGVSWSQLSNPNEVFTALGYGSSKLIAGGYTAGAYTGNLYSSSDGITWLVSNTDDNWYFKIRNVNGQLFALGYSNVSYEGVILQSSDGNTWTDITPNLSFDSYYFNDVVYDGTKYHFMGMEYADIATFAMDDFFSLSTSTPNNPNSFVKAEITGLPAGVQLGGTFGEGAFAYSNGRLVGSVIDITTKEAYVLYSTNGTSWTAVPTGIETAIYGVVADVNTFRMLGTAAGQITAQFSSGTLPVKLTLFDAHRKGNEVAVQWQTSEESSTKEFIVQHSTDARRWTAIGRLDAVGQTTSRQHYQLMHSRPAAGINYYRLTIVDNDGQQRSGDIAKVLMNDVIVTLSPNPASANLNVRTSVPGTAKLSILNAAGQNVYSNTISTSAQINLSGLRGGIYLLVIEQNGARQSKQFVKQ